MTPFRTLHIRPTQTQIVRFAVSLVLATLLWGWVTQLQDPLTTKTFPQIPIDTTSLPDTLQVVSTLPAAEVELRDAASRLGTITAADVSVQIDASNIQEPGTYRVPLIVNSPAVNERSVEPREVSIQVDDRVTKVFPLTITDVSEGDQTRSIETASPEVSQVTVSGPSSAVDRVASVVLPVALGEEVNDYEAVFTPYAVDASGQPITEVEVLPAEVRTRVEVQTRGKSVSVIPNTMGTPPEGYSIEQRRAIPDTIVVDGPPDVLTDLLFVNTEAVNVSGATESFSTRVGLADLPEGVRVIDASGGTVEVRIAITNTTQSSQSLSALRVEQIGLERGLSAEIDPPQVSLQVSAPIEVLQAMRAEDIKVFVDLTGLGPGTYTLQPEAVVPQGATWLGNEPSSVTVTISTIGTEGEVQGSPLPFSTPVATPE
jgi:YbbR domain-containing protein